MSEQKTTTSPHPSKMSWCVAALSTAFVLLTLFLGEMIARGYYYGRIQTAFEKSFSASTDLNFAVDNPEFAELFVREQKQIKILRPLISLLSQDDGVKAAAYWKRQNPPKTPLHQRLGQMVADLDLLASQNEAQKGELEKVTMLETSKAEYYVQLKSDFRSYLGMESKARPELEPRPDTPPESSICDFYRGGMLAAMPVLASLPDDIVDFRDLGRYFTLAKPGLPPPSVEAAARGLADLRVRGLSLQAECDSIKLKTSEIISQQGQIEDSEKQILADSRDVIRKILFTLAQPEVDSHTVLVYDLFRMALGKWGYELPSLWVG